MIGTKIGRFQILSQLGQGGMATVWRARDELLGRDVALKILDGKLAGSLRARKRFLNEARKAAALDHPRIVTVYDSGEFQDLVYIALACIEGETLSAKVEQSLLPLEEATRIVIDVGDALSHAHAHGIIHRDVTGRNIMIRNKDRQVFLLDFGLALASWESRLTSTDARLGTVAYMAPELIRGSEANAGSDLYALGIVLYEALTGAHPFEGIHSNVVINAALNREPVLPRTRRPEIPSALEAVVLKAFAREPQDRYESVDRFLTALRGLGSSQPLARPPEVRVDREERRGGGGDLPDPLYLAIPAFEAIGAENGDESCASLAGHMTENVTRALGRALGVRVIPAADQPSTHRSDGEIARALGANAILRATVSRSGSTFRVSYGVLDAWSGIQIRSDVLDGPVSRPFDLEDQVVASLSRSLGLSRLDAPAEPSARAKDPAAGDRYAQALAYLKRHDNEASVDGAIRILEQLAASSDASAPQFAALARAYLHKGELTGERIWESRAASSCERAKEMAPESSEVLVALGQLHRWAGRHSEACQELERALLLRPDDYDARLALGLVLRERGNLERAEDEFRRAIDVQPDDWRGHSALGVLLFRLGRYADAVSEFQRVVELTPDNVRGWQNLGSGLYRLDRVEEAVEKYEVSIRIRPDSWTNSNLGTALYFLGRHEDAARAFRRATELSPLDPEHWGNLGNASRWIRGMEEQSLAALDRAISLGRERLERRPNDARLWAKLAGWLANRDQSAEAIEALDRALDLAPQDVECMLRAGHVHFQLGHRDDCLRWFREAVRRGLGRAELLRSPELGPLREDPAFLEILAEGSSPREGFIDSPQKKEAARGEREHRNDRRPGPEGESPGAIR